MNAPEEGAAAKEECERWLHEYGRVFKYEAYRLTNPDKDLAEDIAAEATMKVCRAWIVDGRWPSGEVPTVSYCKKAVENVWRDHLRKKYAKKTPVVDFGEDVESVNISDSTMSEQDAHDLRSLLDLLPESERKIVYRIYFEGHTVVGAGKKLGFTRSKSYNTHTSALARLNEMLAEGEV